MKKKTAEAQSRGGKREGGNERGEWSIRPSSGGAPESRDLLALLPLCASASLRLFFLTAALLAAGCARGGGAGTTSGKPAAEYPYLASGQRSFWATAGGLAEARPEGGSPRPLPVAPNASVLGSDGKAILAALNGWGVARIEVAPDGAAYRVLGSPLPLSFAGLSTGGIWPSRGGFLVQLYRDPFGVAGDPFRIAGDSSGMAGDGVAAAMPSGGAIAEGAAGKDRLLFFDAAGAASSGEAAYLGKIDASAGGGWELFALFPSRGGWYAEFRGEREGRPALRFFAVEEGAAGPKAKEMRREDFEDALRPRPFTALAPEVAKALGAAAAALGAGQPLVRLRDAGGGDGWFFEGRRVEDAAQAFAWRGASRLLLLLADGRLAVAALGDRGAAGGAVAVSRLEAPAEGACFTALAAEEGGAAGSLAAAAWEAGAFPMVAEAGLVVAGIGNP